MTRIRDRRRRRRLAHARDGGGRDRRDDRDGRARGRGGAARARSSARRRSSRAPCATRSPRSTSHASARRARCAPAWPAPGARASGARSAQALLERSLAEDVLVRHGCGDRARGCVRRRSRASCSIAGTGSIAYGRGPPGVLERVGGWGPSIGDEGGGALDRAARAVDRDGGDRRPRARHVARGRDSHRRARSTTSSRSSRGRRVRRAAQIASLAPVVVASAEAGDLRANALLGLAAEELVLHVRTLARSLFSRRARGRAGRAWAAGCSSPARALRKRVEHRLKSAVPGRQDARGTDRRRARCGAARAAARAREREESAL